MESPSVLSIAASASRVVELLTKTHKDLSDFQARHQIAKLSVTLLMGQLAGLKSALVQICQWRTQSSTHAPENEQLAVDLTISLNGCQALIQILDERVAQLERREARSPNARSKVTVLWEEQTMDDYAVLLNNQMNALNLLIAAIHCRSPTEQEALLQTSESRHIMRLAGGEAASLQGLQEARSSSKPPPPPRTDSPAIPAQPKQEQQEEQQGEQQQQRQQQQQKQKAESTPRRPPRNESPLATMQQSTAGNNPTMPLHKHATDSEILNQKAYRGAVKYNMRQMIRRGRRRKRMQTECSSRSGSSSLRSESNVVDGGSGGRAGGGGAEGEGTAAAAMVTFVTARHPNHHPRPQQPSPQQQQQQQRQRRASSQNNSNPTGKRIRELAILQGENMMRERSEEQPHQQQHQQKQRYRRTKSLGENRAMAGTAGGNGGGGSPAHPLVFLRSQLHSHGVDLAKEEHYTPL